jgi:hypothetical protein
VNFVIPAGDISVRDAATVLDNSDNRGCAVIAESAVDDSTKIL